MRKLPMIFVAFVLVGLAMVPAAGATPPDRFFVPVDDFVSHACPFDVGVHIVTNNEYQTVFSDGSQHVTGSADERLTNLSDPSKSIDFNVSGPGQFIPTADGGWVAHAEGHWLFFFRPGVLGPGSPGLIAYTRGNSTLSVDADGNQTFEPANNMLDVCAALS